MNFALSGILIIILLLPGAVAQRSYYSALINKEANLSVPFSDLLIQGVFWSLILHAGSICVLRLDKHFVDFNFFYNVLIGKESKEFVYTDDQFAAYTRQFIAYMVIVSSLAWALGKAMRFWVRLKRWHIRYNGFKNHNYWFTIFSADDSEELRFDAGAVDLIYLDIMVNAELIYCGILVDFNYSPAKDELENVILEGAKRRVIDKDNSVVGKAVPIPGDILVVNMREFLNINIRYVSIQTARIPEAPSEGS